MTGSIGMKLLPFADSAIVQLFLFLLMKLMQITNLSIKLGL
tara:strand:- start:2003 stop:2125 length:123 start_codon:yes stop_codon:yes gene_type:complete